jgi:hypothetical protein
VSIAAQEAGSERAPAQGAGSAGSGSERHSLTPSHVFQSAERIFREVELIREHEGVTDETREPGTQVNKVPLDVYQKAVELMDKVSRYQASLGMEPMAVQELPFNQLTPQIVRSATEYVLANIRRVKSELGIEEQIEEPSFKPGKTPSDVYELLWRSSYMLDGLVGSLEPSDVFAKETRIHRELRLIAERLEIGTLATSTESVSGKQPRDVLMENYVNMYKIARIQRALNMQPFYVPPLPGGEIRPANVYDTALVILGQLHRIKFANGIEERRPEPEVTEEKTPSDVYAVAKLVQQNIDTILQTVRQ